MQQPPKNNPQYRQFQQIPQQPPYYTEPQLYQQPPDRLEQMPPQQNNSQGQPNRPWWIGVIIVGVIFVSYYLSKSGFQSTTNLSPITTAPSVNASTGSTSAVSNTPTPFSVGEQVPVGYWKVSVNNAKTSRGDVAFSPKSGKIYLIVDVTVINISTSNQLMASGYYFRLTDSTGQPYEAQFTDFGQPPEGTIIPNGKLRGQLIYEVPTTEHSFLLQVLGDNAIGSADAVWSITD